MFTTIHITQIIKINNVNYKFKPNRYPTIQHDCKVIYFDSERTVKFVLQSTPEFHDVHYNELLVVACLKTYFSNAVKSNKSTVCINDQKTN